MAGFNFVGIFAICLLVFVTSFKNGDAANDEDRKTYIVYMGALPQQQFSPSSQHLSMLEDVLESSSSEESLVRSYGRSFNGFEAKLTEKEREKLARKDGVVSVFPSRNLELHTTRSWDFLGLSSTAKRVPNDFESDVIIGVIDSGIWPESKSFSDEGLGPVPEKWKGGCKGGQNFTCNKKVIGARVYNSNLSPENTARDSLGHGTHTASTAAGSVVKDASFYGVGKGEAKGGVPSARIAVYKVCFDAGGGCGEGDALAAFDDAIADGVDIISVSLGFSGALPLESDALAIGAFHAMAKGVLTSCSAGNEGPAATSVVNIAPWIMTVAASTIDRRIISKVVLGNGDTVDGISINPFVLNGTSHSLVYGRKASTCPIQKAQGCLSGCLNEDLSKGKIVLCKNDPAIYAEPVRVGAMAAITLVQQPFKKDALQFPTPATSVIPPDFAKVEYYVNTTSKPRANILKSESIKDTSAPIMADFSARGPTRIIPDILKPDITAPGVNILAAFSPFGKFSEFPGQDNRSVPYAFLSGTSMSCPHAAGVAAYVKSYHPTWSPAAIKSAIMTSARVMDLSDNPDEFAYGSGHVNPVKARDPGLVYEASKEDYIKMMCSMGMGTNTVRSISGDQSSCPKNITGSPRDLNYPSMTAMVSTRRPFDVKFPRAVTNVGHANSTYKAKIRIRSPLMKVEVNPSTLSFKSLNETKSFVVTVTGGGLKLKKRETAAASLVWSDGVHHVRSPILVYVIKKQFPNSLSNN